MAFKGSVQHASDLAASGAGFKALSTTSSQVVAANASRVEITICNDDAAIVVYLGLGTAAVVNKGIRLNAAGGSYTTRAFTGAINAVAVSGTPTVTVAEV